MMYRLAIVASHPIQYHAPWYRALTKVVDLHVFYAHRATPEQQADAGFHVAFEWDVPLLDGYSHTFLRNRARRPGTSRFFGCDTPDVADAVASGGFDAVLVNGWNLRSYWQAVLGAQRAGIAALVRGDSRLSMRHSTAVRIAKESLYPAMLRRFDAFLSVGEHNSEYLRHYGVAAQKIFRVPHCVDNDFFGAGADAARRAGNPRQRFGLHDDSVVFLFAGKFVDFKRPGDLLAAAAGANRRGDIQVLMVGDGPLRCSLESFPLENRVPCVFAGFLNQSDIASAFAASDVLVLPSNEQETWGLVVNEAMAAGLPAIVSDEVGCAPDLIVEEKTGFTYPCGDVGALRARMYHLSNHREMIPELAKAAHNHIRNFSFSAGFDGLLAALEFVTSRKNTHATRGGAQAG